MLSVRFAAATRRFGRLGFTAVYTLTVLPFTVQFFSEFVRPPSGPWTAIYLCALPPFLAALEYAGVSLACLFWRERQREALLLFAACQALAVAATFYDVRAMEWRSMAELRARAIAARTDEEGREERQESSRRKALEARLAAVDSGRAEARRQVLSLASNAPGRARNDAERFLESRRLDEAGKAGDAVRASLKSYEDEAAELRKRLAALADAPPAPVGPLPGTSAPTALAYVGGTLFAGSSVAAALLALLFPTTVLAMGRVVSASEEPSGPLASVDLSRELAEGAALPRDRHDSYASLLEPVLAAHLASVKATRGAAARGLGLHLELAADLEVLESAAELRRQVEESGLAPSARERLSAFVDRLVADSLSPAANPT